MFAMVTWLSLELWVRERDINLRSSQLMGYRNIKQVKERKLKTWIPAFAGMTNVDYV